MLVLIGSWWVPRDIGGFAVEEIGHEDAILVLIRGGENIGSLEGLLKEAKDV